MDAALQIVELISTHTFRARALEMNNPQADSKNFPSGNYLHFKDSLIEKLCRRNYDQEVPRLS